MLFVKVITTENYNNGIVDEATKILFPLADIDRVELNENGGDIVVVGCRSYVPANLQRFDESVVNITEPSKDWKLP